MPAQAKMHPGVVGGEIAARGLHAPVPPLAPDHPRHGGAVRIAPRRRRNPKPHAVAPIGKPVHQQVGRTVLVDDEEIAAAVVVHIANGDTATRVYQRLVRPTRGLDQFETTIGGVFVQDIRLREHVVEAHQFGRVFDPSVGLD